MSEAPPSVIMQHTGAYINYKTNVRPVSWLTAVKFIKWFYYCVINFANSVNCCDRFNVQHDSLLHTEPS